MEKNATLKGSELQDAAQKAGFDAAYVALAPFPQVIRMMAQNSDWTKALGQAYTSDKKAVFDSIQRLRAQALAAGNLKTTSQQKVETQATSDGQQVIVIQPANPQVIYVPTYNPQTVYVAAPPPPPSGASVAGAAVIGFTAGVIIGGPHNSYYHDYDDYWDDREDYYEDWQQNYQQNQDQRQANAQANQDQRQSNAQANQDQRQSNAQANQSQRQSAASSAQSQRPPISRSASPARPPHSHRGPRVNRSVKVRRLLRAEEACRPPRKVAIGVPGVSRAIRAAQPLEPRARVATAAFPPAGAAVAEAGAGAGEGKKPGGIRRMNMRSLKHVVLMAMLVLAILFAPAGNKSLAQAKFATPDEAAAALHQAFKTQDMGKIQAIFGRKGMEAVASGDPVSDRHDREVIALAMEQSWRWAPHGTDAKELIIGDEQWPFPVSLVKIGNEW